MEIIMHAPVSLEEHFQPGLKLSPLLLIGSQTHDIWKNSAYLQAPEDYYLAAMGTNNVAVVRNIDPNYITYFSALMDGGKVINLYNVDGGAFLAEYLLKTKWAFEQIQRVIHSGFHLMPFGITNLEQSLAKKFRVPIYGSKQIAATYGTKSGIRRLAQAANIPVSPGYICTTLKEIEQAIHSLRKEFRFVALKHDTSVSGFLSKRLSTRPNVNVTKIIEKLFRRPFLEKEDVVVIEGWIDNASSIGAHIEIAPGKKPVVCAAWQQHIDADGVSYIGAGPMQISLQALAGLKNCLTRLAQILADYGAVGSFGPDFLITADHQPILLELNARVPYTAFPLEIIRHIKGTIGEGFSSAPIFVKKSTTAVEVLTRLSQKKLLVTKKDRQAKGVVPFHMAMLPWGMFNIAAMGDTWKDTQAMVQQVRRLFGNEQKGSL